MSVTLFLFFYVLESYFMLFFPQWASISCKAGLGLVSKYLGFLNVCPPSLFYFVVWRIPHDGHGVYRLYVQQRVDCILCRCLAQLWLREQTPGFDVRRPHFISGRLGTTHITFPRLCMSIRPCGGWVSWTMKIICENVFWEQWCPPIYKTELTRLLGTPLYLKSSWWAPTNWLEIYIKLTPYEYLYLKFCWLQTLAKYFIRWNLTDRWFGYQFLPLPSFNEI